MLVPVNLLQITNEILGVTVSKAFNVKFMHNQHEHSRQREPTPLTGPQRDEVGEGIRHGPGSLNLETVPRRHRCFVVLAVNLTWAPSASNFFPAS